jgi:membrane fusion protein (multidrug efflux system)
MRDLKQLQADAISQAAFDNSAANCKTAKAQMAEQQALVDKKTIRAPFAGQLGIRAVDLGQFLAAGTKIVTLQTLDPIYADFSLPQQDVPQLAVGQSLSATIDAFPGETFSGEVTALDPLVSADTRNVQVRATLRNPAHRLLPGMFARLEIKSGSAARYLTLPQTAVSYNSYGETIYVLVPAREFAAEQAKAGGGDAAGAAAAPLPDDQLVARQAFVTVGPTRGDQVAILKGIKEGDQIVTSGALKLHNGAAVTVDNKVLPSNDAAPKPVDE